jgi:DNA-binding response OmpR family regulator
MRVLLVEDEKKIADLIVASLHAHKIDFDWISKGTGALAQIKQVFYDVIVLDLMLPGRDGLSILRDLRKNGLTVPVLILSAKGTPPERINGLNHGADDYLAKPFIMEELIARLRALARRKAGDHSKLQCGDLCVDLLARTVTRAGNSIELTPREFTLLEFLLRAEGRIVSRSAILQGAWSYNFEPGTNVVDVYIKRVRQKIDGGHEAKLLHTERNLGYALRSS